MEDVIFIIKDRKTVDGYMVVSDDFIDDSYVIHQIATLTGDIKGHNYSWISLSSLSRIHDTLSEELFNETFPFYRDALNIVGFLIDGGELL